MTNQAVSAILDYLCNEARNSAHAYFGIMELLRDATAGSAGHPVLSVGTASADAMMRSIDDARELLSPASPPLTVTEEFDLALCAGEIVDVLNLASARRSKRITLDAPPKPLLVTHDRRAVEHLLSRVLAAALKLSHSEFHLTLSPSPVQNSVRLAIEGGDESSIVHLARWLTADPEHVSLQDPDDVPLGVSVMVAAKQLRAFGGSSQLLIGPSRHPSTPTSMVVLDLPAQVQGADCELCGEDSVHGTLNILLAEDCDDSYALSALALEKENVWRARDGAEAVRMVQNRRFDVVFMDVHMPAMDGYSAIRSIRDWETQTSNARTPIVVLSSDDLETQHRSAAQSGCSGFLRKPLRRSELTNLLHRLRDTMGPLPETRCRVDSIYSTM